MYISMGRGIKWAAVATIAFLLMYNAVQANNDNRMRSQGKDFLKVKTDTSELLSDAEIMEKIATAKKYVVFIFRYGPNRSQDEKTAHEIQMAHLRYMFELREKHGLCLQGPFDGNAEKLSGLGIFANKTLEEVKELMSDDPAVKSGRVVIEYYNWLGLPGDTLK